jgi:16S rRNA (cytosine1402-N4)-methyltransferase
VADALLLPHPIGTASLVDDEPIPASPVHRPVLLDEVVTWLDPRPGAVIVDGTAGAGGHTAALARRVAPKGRVIALDRDPDMLALAAEATRDLPVTLVHAPYDAIGDILAELGPPRVDALLLDLGLSSDQLAWSHRGFSFATDGPLDMRFDPAGGDPSAADLVNTLPESDLADLIYKLGEERHSRRVARRIVEARKVEPFRTTTQLAQVVRRAIPGKWGPIDPATRVFQALRIAVNGELDRLDTVLQALPNWLAEGARVGIISFHSLEDRPVKWAFRNDPRLTVLTKKPIVASDDEIRQNPRARSAKLRVAQRCTTTPSTPAQAHPATDRPGRRARP